MGGRVPDVPTQAGTIGRQDVRRVAICFTNLASG